MPVSADRGPFWTETARVTFSRKSSEDDPHDAGVLQGFSRGHKGHHSPDGQDNAHLSRKHQEAQREEILEKLTSCIRKFSRNLGFLCFLSFSFKQIQNNCRFQVLQDIFLDAHFATSPPKTSALLDTTNQSLGLLALHSTCTQLQNL